MIPAIPGDGTRIPRRAQSRAVFRVARSHGSGKGRNVPVPEALPPKFGRVRLGDAKLIAGKHPVGEYRLQLGQHVAEDEAELGEVATIVGRLVEHLLLALLEQLDRLLALTHEIVDEDAKVLVAVQDLHPVLVLAVDEPQPLIRVRQDVEDERRRVLEVHALMLAELHHLIHQLPGLVQGALVGRELRRRHRVREAAVQLLEDRADGVDGASAAAMSGRRHLDGRTNGRMYVRACVRA